MLPFSQSMSPPQTSSGLSDTRIVRNFVKMQKVNKRGLVPQDTPHPKIHTMKARDRGRMHLLIWSPVSGFTASQR